MKLKIDEKEKKKLIKVIKKHEGIMMSVSQIADKADFNPNRTRFIIEELLEEGRIKRNVEKKFNDRYIRYSYEVVK